MALYPNAGPGRFVSDLDPGLRPVEVPRQPLRVCEDVPESVDSNVGHQMWRHGVNQCSSRHRQCKGPRITRLPIRVLGLKNGAASGMLQLWEIRVSSGN